MNRNHILGLLVSGLVVLSASAGWAAQADELREHAKAIQREAAQLAEQGRTEAAEKLKREAHNLLEAAERGGKKDQPAQQRMDLDTAIEKLEAQMVDIRNVLLRLRDEGAPEHKQAEVRDRLAEVERELVQLRGKRKEAAARAKRDFASDVEREHAVKIDAATERIRHIVTAAEHLDQAGIHDLAGQLRSKAASMKQELDEQDRRSKEKATHHQAKKEHVTDAEISELRALVKKLEAEVKMLRENTGR